MADYGQELRFGVFIAPVAGQASAVVELARMADVAGLDLVTFQDHPYQARFLDTWTLLSNVAAQTTSIRVAPNVANLPLRPPVVLARSVASLDILSGGRVELGLGAGAFWDGIAAMGGPRLTPGQSVDALSEAVDVIRATWAPSGSIRHDGEHYRVHGAHAGPPPAHDVEIWLGAYKPRMLALTGAKADGWLPSQGYLDLGDLPEMNARIDAAAYAAGRDPAHVRRLLNVNGSFGTGAGFLEGSPRDWAEQLADLTLRTGMSTYILSVSAAEDLRRFADEVAPAVREAVLAEQAAPTREPGAAAPAPAMPSAGQHLVDVHDALRGELDQLRDLIEQVSRGGLDPQAARSHLNRMTIRQNHWTLGTFCQTYCRVITGHHTLEDRSIFPHLRRSDPELAAVLDRLEEEHETIADMLERIDRALAALVAPEGDGVAGVRQEVDALTDALLAHFAYEERELVPSLDRHGFY